MKFVLNTWQCDTMVALLLAWSMPRIQILNHKYTHTKRERSRFMRFSKMPTFPGQKRDLLMIYIRYNRITIGL